MEALRQLPGAFGALPAACATCYLTQGCGNTKGKGRAQAVLLGAWTRVAGPRQLRCRSSGPVWCRMRCARAALRWASAPVAPYATA